MRNAISLSLLFSGLIASCQWESVDCGGPAVSGGRTLVVTEAEFQYFSFGDGELDITECLNLCSCLGQDPPRSPAMRPSLDGSVDVADALTGDERVDGETSDAASHDAENIDTAVHDASTDEAIDGASDDADAWRADGTGGAPAAEAGRGGGGTGADDNPTGRRCGTMWAGFHDCRYHGPVPNGHLIGCIRREYSGPVCGRNSACHGSLGRGIGNSAVARWLAFAAATEAASIRSFLTLRRELRRLGAPLNLVARAHRAARDEARHTRWMLGLARAKGGRVEWPRTVQLPPRDIEAVAIENAVEGCVHETWAALLNTHQATRAADPEVRAVMARIAADETSHAELAHDIDRWAMSALSEAGRARAARSKREAARALMSMQLELPPSARAVLGLPDRRRMRFLAEELGKHLFVHR